MGGAAATGNLAVGAWVLHANAQLGMVASQGFSVSPIWVNEIYRRLAKGITVEDAVSQVTEADSGRDFRQLAALDTSGSGAVFTGDKNTAYVGHRIRSDLIVAGNWLSGPEVLDRLEAAFFEKTGSLAERLLHALKSAYRAGSDSRGTLSATLKVVSRTLPPLDLRIDFSETPLADLERLYERTLEQRYQEFVDRLPTLEDPYKC